MSEIVMFSSFSLIIILFLISLYRMNRKIVLSIKNIAQFVQGREKIENVKEKIIELKEANNSLIEEIKMGRIFYDNSIESIAILDQNKKIVSINPAFKRITEYSIDEIKGKSLSYFDSGRHQTKDYDKLHDEAFENGFVEEKIWNRKRTGESYIQKLTLIAIKNSDLTLSNYIAIFKDITEETENHSKLIIAAKHDALTGLPNRSFFLDRLEQDLIRAKRDGHVGAVMFLDLDHFKSINDTLGHHIGDLLLKEVATRLSDSVRMSDTVARMSGDEFTIVLPMIKKIDDAGLVAETIINNIIKPYKLEDNQLTVTCSVGVSVFPHDGTNVEELLHAADQAMYTAKTSGRNTFKFYSRKMNETAHAKRNIDKEIRKAINDNSFYFEYIPVYDNQKNINLVDLKINLESNKKELQNIQDILNLTEESSLIIELTDWMLNNIASRDLELLKFNKIKISIPLSAIHFKQNNIVDKLIKLFNKEDSKFIQIKIDESIIAKNVIEAFDKLEKLTQYGFDICIDSFGTGKISYDELSTLSFSSIKTPKNLSIRKNKKLLDYIISSANNLDVNLYISDINNIELKKFIDEKENNKIFKQGLLYSHGLNRIELLEKLK